ncbi:hypothetical protein K8I61_18845 [bacterium]|nr:hypothetical protein [bacterium]
MPVADALTSIWQTLHASPLVREAFGLSLALAWLFAMYALERRVIARNPKRAAVRRNIFLAANALWMPLVFRRAFLVPTAIAIVFAALLLTRRLAVFASRSLRDAGVPEGADAGEAREAREARNDLRSRLDDVYSARTAFWLAGLALAPLFWDQGSLFGGGWRFNMIGPMLGHAAGAVASTFAESRFGRRRFKFKGAASRTVEGAMAYLAASFAAQLAVYAVWSQIPGVMHGPRVVLWAIVGASAGTLAALYAGGRARPAAAVLASAAALYVYVAA